MNPTKSLILLVEDNPLNRQLVRDILIYRGHEVMEAATVSEAKLKLEQAKPDLVLLDVQLPDMDGFEVAEQLCKLADPPAVVLTSSRDSADYGSCIQICGAHGFVPKADLSGAAIAALLIA